MKPNIFIALMPRENPPPCAYSSMFSLMKACDTAREAGIDYEVNLMEHLPPGFMSWSSAIDIFLREPKFTHLFIAGDDVDHPRGELKQLCEDDKDMVCPVYRTRLRERVISAMNLGDEENKNISQYLNEKKLVRSPYILGHDPLIKRAVLEKLCADYPELVEGNPGEKQRYLFAMPFCEDGKWHLNDDWAISRRAVRSGFETWCDFGVILGHECGGYLYFPTVTVEDRPK